MSYIIIMITHIIYKIPSLFAYTMVINNFTFTFQISILLNLNSNSKWCWLCNVSFFSKLSYSKVVLWVKTHMCGRCVHAVCVHRKTTLGIFLDISVIPCIFGPWSLTNLGSVNSPEWGVNEIQGSSCCYLPRIGIINLCHYVLVICPPLRWVLRSKLRFSSTLLTELSA